MTRPDSSVHRTPKTNRNTVLKCIFVRGLSSASVTRHAPFQLFRFLPFVGTQQIRPFHHHQQALAQAQPLTLQSYQRLSPRHQNVRLLFVFQVHVLRLTRTFHKSNRACCPFNHLYARRPRGSIRSWLGRAHMRVPLISFCVIR
jgi:hypothetical protein